MGAADLVGKRVRVRGQRVGVGHLEHRRDAAHDRRAAAGLEIFLVLVSGLAEMNLAVDDAGQHVQARHVDGFAGVGLGEIAEFGDPAGGHADVARHPPVMIDDRAVAQDQIEGFGQNGTRSLKLWVRLRKSTLRFKRICSKPCQTAIIASFPTGRSCV